MSPHRPWQPHMLACQTRPLMRQHGDQLQDGSTSGNMGGQWHGLDVLRACGESSHAECVPGPTTPLQYTEASAHCLVGVYVRPSSFLAPST